MNYCGTGLVNDRSQFIIATHSPILMAYPDAWIYQIGPKGLDRIAYEDTEHYQVTREFLNRPEGCLTSFLAAKTEAQVPGTGPAQRASLCSGRPLRRVSANSSSWLSVIDSYIWREAPTSSLTGISPRLAARAAPAALCWAFDLAGIVHSLFVIFRGQRRN
jgi:hypothetical protein